MKIGLFTDIHFQPKGLNRIWQTGEWITQEFERRQVEHVICLGDSLNTREEVSIEAQSACVGFFHGLLKNWPVDKLLGNHDINLKHSNRVSSSDALTMHPDMNLHRDPGIRQIGGRNFLMMPYTERQEDLVALVQKFGQSQPELAAQTIGMGHLGINGAVQITRYNTTFAGAVGPDAFNPLFHTYTGHFHVMQRMGKVTYLGSPLQFNFGDAGDQRGCWILDTETGADEFIINPYCDAFRFITADQIDTVAADPSYRDTFVTVIYDDFITPEEHHENTEKLQGAGILSVQKESVVEKAIRSQDTVEVAAVDQAKNLTDIIQPFVEQTLSADSALDRAKTIEYGKGIIGIVNGRYTEVSDQGAIFEADITHIVVEGFMGVTDQIVIDFNALKDGIWLSEGENGAGKSTLIEAIYWCYWGETLRSDMRAADVINDFLPRGKGCRVALFHRNGYAIERWRKGASQPSVVDANMTLGDDIGVRVFKAVDGVWQYQDDLEKGEPKATQREINDLLGIDAATASKTAFLGQNITTNFVSGGEKERRRIIEDMLGMERFDEYLAEIRTDKKTIGEQIASQEQIQVLRSQELDRIATSVTSINQRISDTEVNTQTRINELGQQIHDLGVERRTLDSQGDEVLERGKQQLAEAQKAHQDAQKAASDYRTTFDTEKAKVDAEADEWARLEADITGIESTINEHMVNIHHEERMVNQGKNDMTRLEGEIAALDVINEQEVVKGEQVAADFDAKIAAQEEIANLAMGRRQECANRGKVRGEELLRFKSMFDNNEEGTCDRCGQSIKGGSLEATYNRLTEEEQADQEIADKAYQEEVAARNEINTLTFDRDQEVAKHPNRVSLAAAQTRRETKENQLAQAKANAESTKPATLMAALREALLVHGVGHDEELDGLVDRRRAALAEQKLAEATQMTTNWDEVVRLQDHATQAGGRSAQLEAAIAQAQADRDSRFQEIDTGIEVAKAELNRLQTEDQTADLKVTLTQTEGQRAEALADIEKAKGAMVDLGARKAILLYWEKAFAAKGGLRSFLLEESVVALNMVTEGYTNAMFPGQVITLKPDLTYEQRYGKKSGGQRKVLDVATLFSLFELSLQRLRFRPRFMMLDEIFDALDRKRQKAMQDVIGILAQRVGKIIVITHADCSGMSLAGSLYATMDTPQIGTKWTIKPT